MAKRRLNNWKLGILSRADVNKELHTLLADPHNNWMFPIKDYERLVFLFRVINVPLGCLAVADNKGLNLDLILDLEIPNLATKS